MGSAGIDAAKHGLLAIGIILAVGSVCVSLARTIKVPDVVVFLLAGLLLGPEVFGWIDVKADSGFNQLILIFGSCYILFDGGASLRLKVLQKVWITITLIATVGVVITALLTGFVSHYILDIPFVAALLLGATIASTDPATLVPVFKQVKIKDRVAQTVMSESAFNDATGAILTFGVLSVLMGKGEFELRASLIDLLKQSGIGILAGAVLGYTAAFVIGHEKYSFLREHAPLVTLIAVVGAFLGADNLQASGFMAVFVAGIVLGNKEIFGFNLARGGREKMDDFVATTALIVRMFIFLLLGSQVNFALVANYFWSGVAVILIFMFIVRPVAVFICALPDRRAKWSFNELIFMCWTRETGVIPGALAGILLGMKAPYAEIIASITFIAILMTIIIQATTTKWLAGKLGLLEE